ncbi:MAG: hypothetical protein Q4C49_00620 [Bacillota bacterium]|nr:hypothetical protein [Bacillota bacterium]
MYYEPVSKNPSERSPEKEGDIFVHKNVHLELINDYLDEIVPDHVLIQNLSNYIDKAATNYANRFAKDPTDD